MARVHPILSRIWRHLLEAGSWPPRATAELWFDEAKLPRNAYELEAAVPGLSVGDPVVSIRPARILQFREATQLLDPVPAILRRIADEYVAEFGRQPFFGLEPQRRFIPHEFFVEAVGPAEADRLVRLLSAISVEPLRHPTSSTNGVLTFRLHLDVLKYGDVETLGDWKRLIEKRHTAPGVAHRRVVDEVARRCEHDGDWPLATAFAIQNRSLGFVPDLISDVGSPYTQSSFPDHQNGRLELFSEALSLLTCRVRVVATLDKALPQILKAWRAQEGVLYVSRLAETIGVPIRELGFALRFLLNTGLQISVYGGDSSEWRITLGPHVREIETWGSMEGFLARREAERQAKKKASAESTAIRLEQFELESQAARNVRERRLGAEQREQLRKEYRRLCTARSMPPQKRGQRFNGFLQELIASYGLPAEADVLGKHGEIDIGFRLGERRIIVQAKWEKDRTNADPIQVLRGRMAQRLDVTGFFVSMAGYTKPALADADAMIPHVLLFTRAHVEALLDEGLTAQRLFNRAIDLAAIRGIHAPSMDELQWALGERKK